MCVTRVNRRDDEFDVINELNFDHTQYIISLNFNDILLQAHIWSDSFYDSKSLKSTNLYNILYSEA